jgi:uncharacterized protein YxjI
MKYMLKEKVLSWSDTYEIHNENKELMFTVKGKAFSFGDKLSIYNASGQEVAFIEQKMLAMMPRYRLYKDGELFAEVQQKISWFKKKFILDVPGPNDYTIDGSFWDHNYLFQRKGRVVASVSKKMFSWSDTYGIDIISSEDDVSILATAIIIDLVCDRDNN